MPLHEYSCRKCEQSFEVLVAARETAVVKCPSCESEQVERHFGLPARPVAASAMPTNCAGSGPPCGAPRCGRKG